MAEQFSVSLTVRGYETDAQGHLNQAVYLQYAEHARWKMLEAAGIRQQDLLAAGVGPVVLENKISYRRELLAGEDVDIAVSFTWGEGKTFVLDQTITKADGTLSAEVTTLGGILDLTARKLVADPRGALLELATDATLLGT